MSNDKEDKRLSAKEALDRVRGGALLVDVRSPVGRGRSGELEGAIIVAKADALSVIGRISGNGADLQQVVIFCGSTDGSGPVVEALHDAGFGNVSDVEGGFAALKEAGATVIAPPSS